MKTVVLRVPFSALTSLSTVAERFGHVTKVDYFHRDGVCDIHLRYVPRGAASPSSEPRSSAHSSRPHRAVTAAATAPRQSFPAFATLSMRSAVANTKCCPRTPNSLCAWPARAMQVEATLA